MRPRILLVGPCTLLALSRKMIIRPCILQ
ncbi:MAG: hypothetical protein EZS28_023376, partial [Streblomastix strix]